jgi:hypothetical protein
LPSLASQRLLIMSREPRIKHPSLEEGLALLRFLKQKSHAARVVRVMSNIISGIGLYLFGFASGSLLGPLPRRRRSLSFTATTTLLTTGLRTHCKTLVLM